MTYAHTARRVRNLYDPHALQPFRLSRSKIELFLECPRCFYLDRRLGIGRPEGPPFTLNKAVDTLLKKEFDIHRAKKTQHPLMAHYGVEAVPFDHTSLPEWRENFVGVQALHQPTNLLIFGAIDDVWVGKNQELFIVDYKATSTTAVITLESEYRQAYKRQMEIYQWLMRRNGFTVSDTGYFVYVNGKTDREAFDGKLEFDVELISYTGSDAWVEGTIIKLHQCLVISIVPAPQPTCSYCAYAMEYGKLVR